MAIIKGGYNVYGYKIGVLMLDSKFPRIPGDVGNAESFKYPVLFKKVNNAKPKNIVIDQTDEFLKPFIDAAKELELEGVKAITTSCGFLARFQDKIAENVKVPVFTSALLMVPMVCKMVGSDGLVGILTANKSTLSDEQLFSAGIDKSRVVIEGLETKEEFTSFTVENREQVDTDKCRRELCESAKDLVDNNPDIKAVVLECTNMPPYTNDIKATIGLPVFDIINLADFMYKAL